MQSMQQEKNRSRTFVDKVAIVHLFTNFNFNYFNNSTNSIK